MLTTAKMIPPLPVDYVRPSLPEFLAASKTHTQSEYLPWCQRYEAALRHSVPLAAFEPAAAVERSGREADSDPPAMGDPNQPWEYIRDAGGVITGIRAVESASVEPASVESASVEPASVESASVEPAAALAEPAT